VNTSAELDDTFSPNLVHHDFHQTQVALGRDTDIYYLLKDNSEQVVLGVRVFLDKSYQAYYRVVGGDTHFGDKQEFESGARSTAEDDDHPENDWNVWIVHSDEHADGDDNDGDDHDGGDELPVEPAVPEYVPATEDVARAGKATQSSDMHEYSTADIAINGQHDSCLHSDDKLAETDSGSPSWWQVDLGSQKRIKRVVTHAAADFDNDLTDYTVYVGDDSNYSNNQACPGTYTNSQEVACDLRGQYVTIVAEGIIRLCEVEVFEF